MMLARLLSRIYKKKSGIILIDSKGQKYICGKPDLNKPITVKLLNKNLNWKPKIFVSEGINRIYKKYYNKQ